MISQDYFEALARDLIGTVRDTEYLALDLIAEDSQFARFNSARVRQLGTVTDASVRLRFHALKSDGQRTNSASLTLTGKSQADAALLATTLGRLREAAAGLPVDPYAEIPETGTVSSFQRAGALLAREQVVERLLREARGLDFTGIYAAGDQARALCDSRGNRHWFATGNFALDYSVYGSEERSYKGYFADNRWDDAAFARELENARTKLAALANPIREIPRGSYRTFLAPAAAADLIGMLGDAPSEMAIRQGDSPFRLIRSGAKQLSPLFSLVDDFSSGTSPRFNEQGELAPEIFPVIERGELRQTFISHRTAKEFGLKANGAGRGESFRAPVMAGGALAEAAAVEKLGEGLYLSNLHYLNWSDQQGGRITGMTRFACFWVENGKLAAPIKNLRWDDEIFRLFGSELEAVTKETHLFPDTSSYEFRSIGALRAPGLLLRSMHFTL